MNKIKKITSIQKIIILCIGLLSLLFMLQGTGTLMLVCDEIQNFGVSIAGYEKKVYTVDKYRWEPLPVLGESYIEQEIHLYSDSLFDEEIMFEISVANYDRINNGPLYVSIQQNEVEQIYEMDMKNIEDDMRICLISETKNWEEGIVRVKIYSPISDGTNCIAVYVVNNTDLYKEVIVNGESEEMNACIDVSIPSEFAESHFIKLGESNAEN